MDKGFTPADEGRPTDSAKVGNPAASIDFAGSSNLVGHLILSQTVCVRIAIPQPTFWEGNNERI